MTQTIPYTGKTVEEQLDQRIPYTGRVAGEPIDSVTPSEPYVPVYNSELKDMNYSEDDLRGGLFQDDMREWLRVMHGEHTTTIEDPDKITEMFLNSQRGMMAGNSVRTVNQLAKMYKLDDQDLVKVARGKEIYDNMQGLFGDTSILEKAEIVQDWTREIVIDPVNLFSLGIGKLATKGAGTAATTTAQSKATKAMAASLATGASREAAEKVGKDTFTSYLATHARSQSAKMMANQAVRDGTEGAFIRKMTNELAGREIAGALAVDVAAAVGTEMAYQESLVVQGIQDEWQGSHIGFAALGTLFLGGAVGATQLARGGSGLRVVDPDKLKGDPVELLSTLQQYIQEGDWSNKVGRGKELSDLDTNFWATMLVGDSDKNIRGLAEGLVRNFYRYTKRSETDNFSNWISDILAEAPEANIRGLIDTLEEATGASMKDLRDIVDDEGVRGFADAFAKKMSQSGKALGAAGRAAKQVEKGFAPEPTRRMMREAFEEVDATSTMFSDGVEKLRTGVKAFDENFMEFQNNTIRVLVSNPATTALNVVGYGAATSMNTVSDALQGVMHLGMAGLRLAQGNTSKATSSLEMFNVIRQNQVQKLRNLLDLGTTAESFMQYANLRPHELRELVHILPGGVENVVDAKTSFNPELKRFANTHNTIADWAATISLVRAQDVGTKSLEFMTQMDKLTRKKYNKSFGDVLTDTDLMKRILPTEDWVKLEAEAVEATLKSIYSKSARSLDNRVLREIGTAIEDLRRLPLIGMSVPFGRFFNNTMMFMSDVTPVTSIVKLSTGRVPTADDIMRASAGLGLMYFFAEKAAENSEQGLAWWQSSNYSGEVKDHKYEFPISLFMAGGYIMDKWQKGEPVPDEIQTEMLRNVFGQISRDLTDATGGVIDIIKMGLNGGEQARKAAMDAMRGLAVQPMNAWTRFLDPVNETIGLTQGSDHMDPDKKQGNRYLNEATRYMDNFILALSDEKPNEDYSPTNSSKPVDLGKFVGVRGSARTTYIEMIAAEIGMPPWKLGKLASHAEAANEYNRLFFRMVEQRAGDLWRDDTFRNESQSYKEDKFRAIAAEAREDVKNIMSRRNPQFQVALSIETTFGRGRIAEGIQRLGFEKDFEDLNRDELEQLKGFLEYRKEKASGG